MSQSPPRYPAIDALARAVLDIPAPFACGGSWVPDAPVHLRLQSGVELIVPRTSEERAEDLLAPLLGAAKPAPFGARSRTLHDRAVRDSVRVPASEIAVLDLDLAEILRTIREELTPNDPNPPSAELYDVNVYRAGGHFVTHKDTPRGSDMVGTLVVCLPVAFRGGALVASHRGVSLQFDWGRSIAEQAEPNRVHWAAFFGDVDHRVEAVAGGHRVTLAYVLRRSSGDSAPRKEGARAEALASALAAALAHRWFMPEGGVLAFPCFHLYRHDVREEPSATPLDREDLPRLKGADAEVAATALAAGLRVYLTPYVSETCADDTWLLDRFPTAAEARSLRGRIAPRDLAARLPVRSDSLGSGDSDESGEGRPLSWVLPHGSLGDSEDEPGEHPVARLLGSVEYSATGYFGNEGSPTELYLHAAIEVEIPPLIERVTHDLGGPLAEKANLGALRAIVEANPGAALDIARRLATSKESRDRADLRLLSRALVEGWPRGYLPQRLRGVSSQALDLLTELGELQLLERFITGPITARYDDGDRAALTRALRRLTTASRDTLAPTLIGAAADTELDSGAGFFEDLAPDLSSAGAAAAIRTLMESFRPEPRETWRRRNTNLGSALQLVLSGVAKAPGSAASQVLVTEVEASPTLFSGDVLAQSLLQLATEHQTADWFVSLWRVALERLLDRSEAPIPPPTDWAQVPNRLCNCRNCAPLLDFLRSPTTQSATFRVAETKRHHLANQLEGQDVTLATLREKRPYSLVVTKTRRTFEAQTERRNQDLALVARLLALTIPSKPEALIARANAVAARGPA
ncbi:MAG: 2OG-Fe(II) oxygenase [Deltaproteobacteria bacterium]|nr:2OG-Fe(II) oxygenase [Deltaproteobacteria bacterium]